MIDDNAGLSATVGQVDIASNKTCLLMVILRGRLWPGFVMRSMNGSGL